MPSPDRVHFRTDAGLLAELPGGQAVLDWFGFVPSFHDATLERLDITEGRVTIVLHAFRMTSETDPNGFFILDRHAAVSIHLTAVTGITLTGNASAIIHDLGIRRLHADLPGWTNCRGPERGDLEVSFESSYGLEGAVFARHVAYEFTTLRAE